MAAASTLTDRYLLHLMVSALNGTEAQGLPAGCAWEDVYEAACMNSIPGLVWEAARGLPGMSDDLRERWQLSSTMTMLRSLQLDAERELIASRLREAGLSYVVLKGAVLAAKYPSPTMRSMADNDILYGYVDPSPGGGYVPRGADEREVSHLRSEAASVVTQIMGELGYVVVEQGEWAADIHFAKAPCLNFELHHALMETRSPLYAYYENPWRLARRAGQSAAAAEGAGEELVFSDEDQYVYMIAHAFKHVNRSGFGVRLLADIAVTEGAAGEDFDWGYVSRELCELGIDDFERLMRGLTHAVMSEGELDENGAEIVRRMIACGTYGSEEEKIKVELGLERRRAEKSGTAAHPRLGTVAKMLTPDDNGPVELRAFTRHGPLRPLYPLARIALFAANALRRPGKQLRKLALLIRGR